MLSWAAIALLGYVTMQGRVRIHSHPRLSPFSVHSRALSRAHGASASVVCVFLPWVCLPAPRAIAQALAAWLFTPATSLLLRALPAFRVASHVCVCARARGWWV